LAQVQTCAGGRISGRNAAQWDIVRALADPAQPGCLFVVGDEKQSVYAFARRRECV
jgi:superfamily I DNA/RNA helicase